MAIVTAHHGNHYGGPWLTMAITVVILQLLFFLHFKISYSGALARLRGKGPSLLPVVTITPISVWLLLLPRRSFDPNSCLRRWNAFKVLHLIFGTASRDIRHNFAQPMPTVRLPIAVSLRETHSCQEHYRAA